MSILCKSDLGAVIDYNNYVSKVYTKCVINHKSTENTCPNENYRMKLDFFNIQSTFMMDSQFDKLKEQQLESEIIQGTETSWHIRKKKKKRKFEDMNEGEVRAVEFHQKVRSILEKAYEQLLSLAREGGHLTPAVKPPPDNNIRARRAAETIVGPGDTLREMAHTAAGVGTTCNEVVLLSATEQEDPVLFNTLVKNMETTPAVRQMLGGRYLLPAQSTFLMSDVTLLDPLLNDGTYDLILMDPPWQNKSVKRKYKYRMLDDHTILNIPISTLASRRCLIVVWATNKQQQHKFIQDQLFRKWKVKKLAQWYWLKVTQYGQLVVDLDNTQKKPYETLFIGRVTHTDRDDSAEPLEECPCDIPECYTFISVPSSIHSHKPALTDILKPYLPASARCLELFARNLLPGWTSWGNEVLKLQHTDYYEATV